MRIFNQFMFAEYQWIPNKSVWIKWYQENCRIYLDEFEVEEIDLRVNFDTSLLMKRFMVKE